MAALRHICLVGTGFEFSAAERLGPQNPFGRKVVTKGDATDGGKRLCEAFRLPSTLFGPMVQYVWHVFGDEAEFEPEAALLELVRARVLKSHVQMRWFRSMFDGGRVRSLDVVALMRAIKAREASLAPCNHPLHRRVLHSASQFAEALAKVDVCATELAQCGCEAAHAPAGTTAGLCEELAKARRELDAAERAVRRVALDSVSARVWSAVLHDAAASARQLQLNALQREEWKASFREGMADIVATEADLQVGVSGLDEITAADPAVACRPVGLAAAPLHADSETAMGRETKRLVVEALLCADWSHRPVDVPLSHVQRAQRSLLVDCDKRCVAALPGAPNGGNLFSAAERYAGFVMHENMPDASTARHAPRSRVVASTAPSGVGADGVLQPLPNGTRVFIKRLDAKPQHNGKHARVLSFDESSGRYAVALDDGRELLLTAACIDAGSMFETQKERLMAAAAKMLDFAPARQPEPVIVYEEADIEWAPIKCPE
jgi:hypothetical protein